MFALKDRSQGDVQAIEWINEAMLCKIFRCTPSELHELDWDVVEHYNLIYQTIAKDNPLIMFM